MTVHNRTIHNKQKIETTQISINWGKDEKCGTVAIHRGTNRDHSSASVLPWLSITSHVKLQRTIHGHKVPGHEAPILPFQLGLTLLLSFLITFSLWSVASWRLRVFGGFFVLSFQFFRFMYANTSVIFPISGPVSFLSKHFLALLTYIFYGCLPKLCLGRDYVEQQIMSALAPSQGTSA